MQLSFLDKDFAADIFLMAIPVGHLRERSVAEAALVGFLTAMHVDVVSYVVELGVGLVAVLAYQQLIWPSSIFI